MADLSARVRPPQLVLAVGAVLLLTGALAAPGEGKGTAVALVAVAVAAGALSAWASQAGLRGTRETLAATAVVLAVAGVAQGGPLLGGSPVGPALLLPLLAGVACLQPGPLSWPLGAWAAGQLAALRLLPEVADGVARTGTALGVALAGLAVTLGARPALARIVLATTAPWWLLGVAGGITTAWSAPPAAAAPAAALTVAAAAGLLLVRRDRAVSPLLGPPRAVPLLAGVVAGAAVAGLLAGGPGGRVAAGYAGVLLAAGAAALLAGRWRGLLPPAALAAGAPLAGCALGQLLAAGAWRELALLFLLTALSSAAVAGRRRADRPAAVPVAVGCLAAAASLAVPAGLLGPAEAAAVLSALYGAALLAAAALSAETRRRTLVVGALTAAAAVLLVAATGASGQAAAHLAVQGAAAWLWAQVAGRGSGEAARARRVGAAELVAAAWVAAAAGEIDTVEAYTLPAAAGLLLAAGPGLGRRPSERAWGPGLLVAALPSTALAVAAPGAGRPLLVLAAAAVALVGGAAAGIRMPLLVGAGTAVALAVGLAVVALPLPLAGTLGAGVALLAVGAHRELRPVGGFAARVAEMR